MGIVGCVLRTVQEEVGDPSLSSRLSERFSEAERVSILEEHHVCSSSAWIQLAVPRLSNDEAQNPKVAGAANPRRLHPHMKLHQT